MRPIGSTVVAAIQVGSSTVTGPPWLSRRLEVDMAKIDGPTNLNNSAGDGGEVSASRVSMWARPHVVFLLIAYVFSWALWIAGWIAADVTDAGDLLFNQDFVWRV